MNQNCCFETLAATNKNVLVGGIPGCSEAYSWGRKEIKINMANNYLICQLYHYLFLIALFQQIPKFITAVVPDLFFFIFLVGITNFRKWQPTLVF